MHGGVHVCVFATVTVTAESHLLKSQKQTTAAATTTKATTEKRRPNEN